jgi:hypothetical protein
VCLFFGLGLLFFGTAVLYVREKEKRKRTQNGGKNEKRELKFREDENACRDVFSVRLIGMFLC